MKNSLVRSLYSAMTTSLTFGAQGHPTTMFGSTRKNYCSSFIQLGPISNTIHASGSSFTDGRRKYKSISDLSILPKHNLRLFQPMTRGTACTSLNESLDEHEYPMRTQSKKNGNRKRQQSELKRKDDPSVELISSDKEYVLRFHGLPRSNVVGAGMVIYDVDQEREIWAGKRVINTESNTHNNEGEYIALLSCLQCATSLGIKKIVIETSSEIVAKQMNGEFNVKSKSLLPLFEDIDARRKKDFSSSRIQLIPKKDNKRAGVLALAAINTVETNDSHHSTLTHEADGGDTSEPILISPTQTNPAPTFQANDGDKYESIPKTSNDLIHFAKSLQLPSNANIVPSETYVLRFDGGSRGNPGVAGVGMVLYTATYGTEVWSGYHYIGDCFTNIQAEYTGLYVGLLVAVSLGVKNIVIQGDCDLVVKQVRGTYQCRSKNVYPLLSEIKVTLEQFGDYGIHHILRERNGVADSLANLAMDTRNTELLQ